jgi:hypothetical protein
LGCGQLAVDDAILSTDPTAITTELPITGDLPSGPPAAAVSASARREDAGTGLEPCAHCGKPLARDQRYCLECGVPRSYLSGMLLERLQGSTGRTQTEQAMVPPNGVTRFGAPSSAPAWHRGNVLTLIAAIGVLLLAMGVGVLIGRSGGSSSAGSAAPQVISVPAPTTGAAGAATTPTTVPESTSTNPSKSPPTKHKGKGAQPSGVGSTPSKPAPPTVLENLRKGGGGSYEQKSKNLPNVVETG